MRSKSPTKRPTPHHGAYTRIGPSRLHGVGVIAIRDIPAGTRVFRGESERVVWVSRAAVRRLPRAVRALYEDFGMVDGRRLGVPPNLNRLSVGWYVNHADLPNVEAGDDGRFRALRRIRAGEELTADYRTFVDEPLAFRPRRSHRASRPRRSAGADARTSREVPERSRPASRDAGGRGDTRRGSVRAPTAIAAGSGRRR
jgi:SET domain-containing protein